MYRTESMFSLYTFLTLNTGVTIQVENVLHPMYSCHDEITFPLPSLEFFCSHNLGAKKGLWFWATFSFFFTQGVGWMPVPGWMWLWAALSSGWQPCPWQGGWNYMIIMVLFNPGHSMILWVYNSIYNPKYTEILDRFHFFFFFNQAVFLSSSDLLSVAYCCCIKQVTFPFLCIVMVKMIKIRVFFFTVIADRTDPISLFLEEYWLHFVHHVIYQPSVLKQTT